MSISMSISMSTVDTSLPIQLSDADADTPTRAFALANWFLPRVPRTGEKITVASLRRHVRVESVWRDVDGHALLTLEEVCLTPEGLDLLEHDGWELAPLRDEPPDEWVVPEESRSASWASRLVALFVRVLMRVF
jgi:hypothetical protein